MFDRQQEQIKQSLINYLENKCDTAYCWDFIMWLANHHFCMATNPGLWENQRNWEAQMRFLSSSAELIMCC
jgi:hypothetical protein